MTHLEDLLAACAIAPTSTLLMSRQHCHAPYISSIVVDCQQGQLRRAFLAWPGHTLNRNRLGSGLTVGIHNHRYALRFKQICGPIRNTLYRRHSEGYPLREWRFRSGGMQMPSVAVFQGWDTLAVQSATFLTSAWQDLRAEELHNIDCTGPGAWWVQEGPTLTEETTLFTESSQVQLQGLYHPFLDRHSVIAHVQAFAQLWVNHYSASVARGRCQ